VRSSFPGIQNRFDDDVVSFIVSFGVVKAIANLISGIWRLYGPSTCSSPLALRASIPFMIGWAPPGAGWCGERIARHQPGSCVVHDVIMKVDLVGPKSRGLPSASTIRRLPVGRPHRLSYGYIRARYGLRPQPFYLGIGYAAVGLASHAAGARHTGSRPSRASRHAASTDTPGFWQIFADSFGDRNLFGPHKPLVNNLNDGMTGGYFRFFSPLLVSASSASHAQAIYPVVWGVLQTVTGPLSDRWGRKDSCRGHVGAGRGSLLTAAHTATAGGSRERASRTGHSDVYRR